MKSKMLLLASVIILTLSLCSPAQAETKTWTTDADWKQGERERIEIVKQGEPSSLVLAACPELRIIDIDGEFSDWHGIRALDTSPWQPEETGDAITASLDTASVWAANNNRYLYLKWKCAGAINFDSNDYSIYLDTDQNELTGFRNFNGNWAIGADYLIQDGNLFKYAGTCTEWNWNWMYVVSYAIGSDETLNDTIEIAFPRKDIEETLCGEERTNILFISGVGAENKDFAPDNPDSQFYTYTYARPVMTVDAKTEDWQGIKSLVADARDMVDADADLKAVYAVNDENYLYLRLDVYGHINPIGHWYVIYLDTDQNNATGFTYGWWATGADYRIYLDEWNAGLQKFMGSAQCYDNWGWNGQLYQMKTADIQLSWDYAAGILEVKIPRADIGETQDNEATNILWRLYGDDSAPNYTSTVEYEYLK